MTYQCRKDVNNKEVAGERGPTTDKHTNEKRTRIIWDSWRAHQNSDEFKPQHNEMIFSKCCILSWQNLATSEEWMGKLTIKAAQYNSKENDRHLKKQFINGINADTEMTSEIIKEWMTIKKHKWHFKW